MLSYQTRLYHLNVSERVKENFQKMCEIRVTAVSRSEDSVRTKDSKYRANTASRVEHLLLGNKFRQISMTPPPFPIGNVCSEIVISSHKQIPMTPSYPPDEHIGLPHHPCVTFRRMARLARLARSSPSLEKYFLWRVRPLLFPKSCVQ